MKLILGTMTFGERIFGEETKDIVSHFLESGGNEIDTAYVYNEGESERLLGDALNEIPCKNVQIATKANPRVTGKLDKDSVIMQLNESLKRLNLEHVDTFYLHFPDLNTNIESALEGCAKLHDEGKFSRLGLSNFPAWLIADAYHICKKNGWPLPKVYQGLYNPLSRLAEKELYDALVYYGLSFYAYNPLAGGLLTNKYSAKDRQLKEGRFLTRPNYQQRYWKESYFQATESIKNCCKKYDIDIVEAVYRWLAYHSILSENRQDGIIIGLSKISQLHQNINALQKGSLPEEVQQAFENGWKQCAIDSPSYFRFYGKKSNI